MKAKCKSCGARFRFDEAKVQQRALVNCPACKARMILQQDPNSAEPNFIVIPIDEAQSPPPSPKASEEEPASAGRQSEPHLGEEEPEYGDGMGLPQELFDSSMPSYELDEPVRPTPKAATRPEIPEIASGPPELRRKPQAPPAASAPVSVRPHAQTPNRPASGTVSLEEEEDPSDFSREFISGSRSEDWQGSESSASAKKRLPRRREPARVMGQGVPEKEPSRLPLLLGGGAAVIVLALLLSFLIPKLLDGTGADDKGAVQKVVHPGEKFIDELAKKHKNIEGTAMQLVKAAELVFHNDTENSYAKAKEGFEKALVLDRDNPEIIVRYVESTLRLHGRMKNMKEIQKLLDLIDYGFTQSKNSSALHRAMSGVYLSIGQLLRAREEAELALRMNPHDMENIVALGRVMVKLNPDKTVELLKDIVNNPQTPLTAIKPLADAYKSLGRFALAEKAYKLRAELDPQSCELCETFGELYTSLGMYEEAEKIYMDLAEKRKDIPAGKLGVAHVNWVAGAELDKCLNILNEFTDEQVSKFSVPDRVKLHTAKSHYTILQGDVTAANLECEKAMALDRNDPLARYQVVLTRLHREIISPDEHKEMQGLLESLELDIPTQPEIWVLHGIFAKKNGDLEAAITHFKRAMRESPAYYHAYMLLAKMYIEAVNYNDAFTTIEKLLGFYPGYWRDHPDMNYYTEKFDYEEDFLKELFKVEETKVDRDRKYKVIGLTAYLFGKTEEARKAFQEVLRNTREHQKTNLLLAVLDVRQERYRDAVHHLSVVFNKDPDNAMANLLMGDIEDRQDNREAAIRRFRRLVSVHPRSTPILALLSIFLSAEGNAENAKELARTAYRLDPDSLPVRYARYYSEI